MKNSPLSVNIYIRNIRILLLMRGCATICLSEDIDQKVTGEDAFRKILEIKKGAQYNGVIPVIEG